MPSNKYFLYDAKNGDRIIRNGRLIKVQRVIDILIAERTLREETQREEVLHKRVPTLRKALSIESETTQYEETKGQLKKAEKELQDARVRLADTRHELYLAECNLWVSFKEDYDNIRRDPTWYMRAGLVQDCADQGGCCSRQCGCCKKRALTGNKKGNGHCTSECGCCAISSGIELTEEQKKKRRKEFKDALELPPGQLVLKMAYLFLCPVQHQHRWISKSGQFNQKI